jgi:hypothetical protein
LAAKAQMKIFNRVYRLGAKKSGIWLEAVSAKSP